MKCLSLLFCILAIVARPLVAGAEEVPGLISPQEQALAAAPRPGQYEVTNSAFELQTNSAPAQHNSATNAAPKLPHELENDLEIAEHLHLSRQLPEATFAYAAILQRGVPKAVEQVCLLALAQIAQDQNDAPRAEQIYGQYLSRWPRDDKVPDILLRQGLIYRQMGLHNLAIAKFYAVMTSALGLKPERFDYYQKLVLEAQNEIANTQFELSNWSEASDSFRRLLNLDPPPLNRSVLQYKLIHCLAHLGSRMEAIAQAQDFLAHFPHAPQRAEVHFLRATALQQVGRNNEAVQQVLALLAEQHAGNTNDPATLEYWQQRAGNEIANRFYQQGEPIKALDIYLRLAALDSSVEWQLPVWYQIGLIFERLHQPAKANEYYEKIATREKEPPDKPITKPHDCCRDGQVAEGLPQLAA